MVFAIQLRSWVFSKEWPDPQWMFQLYERLQLQQLTPILLCYNYIYIFSLKSSDPDSYTTLIITTKSSMMRVALWALNFPILTYLWTTETNQELPKRQNLSSTLSTPVRRNMRPSPTICHRPCLGLQLPPVPGTHSAPSNHHSRCRIQPLHEKL